MNKIERWLNFAKSSSCLTLLADPLLTTQMQPDSMNSFADEKIFAWYLEAKPVERHAGPDVQRVVSSCTRPLVLGIAGDGVAERRCLPARLCRDDRSISAYLFSRDTQRFSRDTQRSRAARVLVQRVIHRPRAARQMAMRAYLAIQRFCMLVHTLICIPVVQNLDAGLTGVDSVFEKGDEIFSVFAAELLHVHL